MFVMTTLEKVNHTTLCLYSAGRPLGDKEVVTAQIVSNWFANKRKEMKKLAREGERNTFPAHLHKLFVAKS